MTLTEKPILFHYPPSIYSHRVLWYLWLRGLPYDECIQPPVMPRPDLAGIDIGYRKIPIMAVGKDVYCDSRLMITKLEALYPGSNLTPSTPAEQGIRKLFENYSVDGGLFANACKLMPYWLENGLLQNKAFLDDRALLSGGRRMTAEGMEAGRPDGLQAFRQVFELMETTFLADGRNWILGGGNPTVADIDAVWPFEWLIVDRNMTGSLPEAHFNPKIYPRTYAWVHRFMDLVETKKAAALKPKTLDGAAMAQRVLNATSPETVGFSDDPLEVKQGDEVEVFPADYGQMGKVVGTLVGLVTDEVVVRNKKGVNVHFPRWNFTIKKISQSPPTQQLSSTKNIPKMRLIYHHYSPYTRKVYMLAHELDLAHHITLEKVVVCPVDIPGWSDNNDKVAEYNPMAKIPCLVPEDVPDGIFDSRMICEYLTNLASVNTQRNARYWQLRALHACADGVMDAAVLITYEERIRREKNLYFPEWVEGQKQKITRGLDRFEVAAKNGILPAPGSSPASADEVAVAVATAMTSHMGFLGIEWEKERPNLVSWQKAWEQRHSFIATPPAEDWVVPSASRHASKM